MYNYSDAINLLLAKFPILKSTNEYNIYDYEEYLPYVFYESVFTPYIMGKIQSSNEVELRSIFNFIEEMLSKGDAEFKNLIEVAIIESLYFEESFNEFNLFLSKYYGSLTKKSFDACVIG